LTRFPKTEWSGPAWYKLEDEEWSLVYFKPIDLGSHGATEFEGDDLLKVMKEVQKTIDITGCFQGIIHSHHGMGAFHSGTDDTELEEGANKVGYPSLVVAHTGAPHAFKYSYEDQFGQVHLIDGDVSVEAPECTPETHWVTEANTIEKAAKKKPIVTSVGYYGNNQGSLWKGQRNTARRYNGWGVPIDQNEVEYNTEYEKMESAQKLFDDGKMTKKKFEKRLKKWEAFESEHFGII
jgi:hypothetical protein